MPSRAGLGGIGGAGFGGAGAGAGGDGADGAGLGGAGAGGDGAGLGGARAAPGGPVLSIRDLSKRYGKREALRGVSFDAAPGELVAVVGPNGAGKTTLLSILAGIQHPSAGTVSSTAREVGWGVGWVPQIPALYSKLSVAENLALFARLERVADPHDAVERMLEQTGLRERATEQVARLSGGNRQRVNVAIGLLSRPPVLALDEPSTALDPGQRERLWSFIRTLAAEGTSVVFSTHDVNEVQRYASRALVLADGELLFDGSPASFLAAAEHGAGSPIKDFEDAFVSFLRARGHR